MPPIPPRADLPEPLIPVPVSNNALPSVPPRKEPPPGNLPLPPVPPRKDLPDLVISSQNSHSSHKNDKTRPPLPVNRPAVSPSSVKRGLVKSNSLSSDERPKPRPRVLPSKDSTEELASQQHVPVQNQDSVENEDTVMKTDSDIQLQEAPSGSSKPKRPTIIRVDKSQKSFSNSSQVKTEKNNTESSLNYDVNKLNSDIEKNSQVNDEKSKISKPPPLAPKPKPKPKLEPQSEKPVEKGVSDWASKVDSFNSLGGNKKPNIIRPPPKPKRVMVDDETASSNKGDITADHKVDEKRDNSDIKKNDISHITVAEGCDYAQVNKTTKTVKEVPKDDMNIDCDSRPPPPVPRKRPSSICNIPQALKEEEMQSARKLESSTVDKFSDPELNVTRRESPNAKRKPVPRMRPMSLAATVTDRGQIGLPNLGRPPPPKKHSLPGKDRSSPGKRNH